VVGGIVIVAFVLLIIGTHKGRGVWSASAPADSSRSVLTLLTTEPRIYRTLGATLATEGACPEVAVRTVEGTAALAAALAASPAPDLVLTDIGKLEVVARAGVLSPLPPALRARLPHDAPWRPLNVGGDEDGGGAALLIAARPVGLIFDTRRTSAPRAGYAELFSADTPGKVALPNDAAAVVEAAAIAAGASRPPHLSAADLTAAAIVMQARGGRQYAGFFSTPRELAALFKRGATLALGTPEQAEYLRKNGVWAGFVLPKDRQLVRMACVAVTTSCLDPDGAGRLAAALLSPRTQSVLARSTLFVPAVAVGSASSGASEGEVALKTGEDVSHPVAVLSADDRPWWQAVWYKIKAGHT
jgi:ABC-type Fe3+ transport system substrate-binding protein